MQDRALVAATYVVGQLRPAAEIVRWRDYVRLRLDLTCERPDHRQRLEQLEDAQVKWHR